MQRRYTLPIVLSSNDSYNVTMPLDHVKIRELRERKKMSQQEAADAAGLGTRQRWNEIETGRRTNIELATLERIAAALGVKSKDLLK